MTKSFLMNINQLLACEAKRLRRNWLLPNAFQQVGLIVLGISMLAFLWLFFSEGESAYQSLAGKGVLLSMLVLAVSKEPVEDEYIAQLRAQSFSLAFIIGVLYALVQPYINYWMGLLFDPQDTTFNELPIHAVLWFMLFIQLGFFHLLKRTR